MKTSHLRTAASTMVLVLALGLAVWGAYGIVTYDEARGPGYDPRFIVFDNPMAPLIWGCLGMAIGYVLRFRFRLQALGLFAVALAALLAWGEVGHGTRSTSAELAYAMLAIFGGLFALLFLDRYLERAWKLIRRGQQRG